MLVLLGHSCCHWLLSELSGEICWIYGKNVYEEAELQRVIEPFAEFSVTSGRMRDGGYIGDGQGLCR